MIRFYFLLAGIFISCSGISQTLKVKDRNHGAVSGSEFSNSITDSSLSRHEQERKIISEIRKGNLPSFLRSLTEIRDTIHIEQKEFEVRYYVLPDYLAIGSDEDYFYVPLSPQSAQRVANILRSSLPTRKISDRIYQNARVKLRPQPIPPSREMVTVPVFVRHNSLVWDQRKTFLEDFPLGSLVAGNKKDVVLSNKMFNKNGELRVVIYGWHQANGKAIQPLYSGHTTDHVDYSHGIRLVQNRIWLNGKKTKLTRLIRHPQLSALISDEGPIQNPSYPVR